MSKRGLPVGVQMRHDAHYVDTIAAPISTIGRKINIDLIEPNPEQPRREIGDLSELSASIKEKGVLEPLLVKPIAGAGKWMIIAGERRWRSAKLAGLTEVPCIEMDLDENGVAEIALIENLQRKDLNVWEEADGLAALAEKFGYTQEQIAQKISKSRSSVTELMTIAGLPKVIRGKCHASKINTKSALLAVARQFDEAAMHKYLDGLSSGKTVGKSSSTPKHNVKAASVTKKGESENGSATYSFSSSDFNLTIDFSIPTDNNRAMVLKVLKRVFENVKGT